MGQRDLIQHGIQDDQSDYRIHIDFDFDTAYLFRTEAGREAVELGLGIPFQASQPGVGYTTGQGRRIPCRQIEDCQAIQIPSEISKEVNCERGNSTTEKGKKAEQVVKELFRQGLIPLPFEVSHIGNKEEQIEGMDLRIFAGWNIQVKCDYGARERGLALQTAERNPLGVH